MASCNGCVINYWDSAGLDEEQIKEFLFNHGILKRRTNCGKCGSEVRLGKDLLFRCRKGVVGPNGRVRCNWKVSGRSGTFIKRARIDLCKLWRMVTFLLASDPPRQVFLVRTLKLARQTVVDWSSFYREVLIDDWVRSSVVLGGVGRVVEVDEAKFGKRKYNRGRVVKGQWVLGGIERGTSNTFMIPVMNRNSRTLIRLIRRWVAPGTTIITDCWRAYRALSLYNFNHLTVNHSRNFVDPDTGAHTNTIERMWRDVRSKMPKYGRKTAHFYGYLSEVVFKQKHDIDNRQHFFFQAAARLYPPKY